MRFISTRRSIGVTKRPHIAKALGMTGVNALKMVKIMKNRTLVKLSAGVLKVLRKSGVNHFQVLLLWVAV